MKRLFTAVIAALLIFALCSCKQHVFRQIEPIRTDVTDFDLQEARKLIEPGDKLIAAISQKETVSREEFDRFISDVKAAYRDLNPWALMFFDNREFDDPRVGTLHLHQNMFYPTIYHEGIDLVSAKVSDIQYEDKTRNRIKLTIKVEYRGDDSKLRGWFREYIYRKGDGDTWNFDIFSGPRANFMGDDFKPDYLKLKQP